MGLAIAINVQTCQYNKVVCLGLVVKYNQASIIVFAKLLLLKTYKELIYGNNKSSYRNVYNQSNSHYY